MPSPTLRAWLEIAYFLSGTIIVIIATLAVLQLRLTRKAVDATNEQLLLAAAALSTARDDIRIRSEREAVSLAATRCEQFAQKLLPRHYRRVAKMQQRGLKFSLWSLRDCLFRWPSFTTSDEAKRWIAHVEADQDIAIELISSLNDFEAFAIYFTSGAADERIAFPVAGALFCHWVEAMAPQIAAARSEPAPSQLISDPYPNTVQLYEMWSGRRRKSQLELAATQIQSELDKLGDQEIRPIGT